MPVAPPIAAKAPTPTAPVAAPAAPVYIHVPPVGRGPALLHRAYGNQALLRAARSNGTLQRHCACGGITGPSGECDACRTRRLARQNAIHAPAAPALAPPSVHQVLHSPGRPLDPQVRAHLEPRFGHDFSHIRIHDDAAAARSADAIAAHAYTVGSHIVFGPGQYRPSTPTGQRLLAHELTHVLQQRTSGPALQPRLEIGAVDAPGEREADQVAAQVMAGTRLTQPRAITPQMQRVMRDFNSTVRICHALLKSRTFEVQNGVVEVQIHANRVFAHEESADEETLSVQTPTGTARPDIDASIAAQCSSMPYYNISLVRERFLYNSQISTHPVPFGMRATRRWQGLASGSYHLVIWTNNTNPNCCVYGDISVATPAQATAIPATTTAGTTACYDGDTLYVNKGGLTHACPALTGSVGDPTPPGTYCIRRQGEAQISGGVRGRLLQDRPSWYLLEPLFATTRFRMQLHPGTMSAGCITVMDRGCFDQLARVLNQGSTTRAIGHDGYPPGNPSGTEDQAHAVDCVGILTVTDRLGACTGTPARPEP